MFNCNGIYIVPITVTSIELVLNGPYKLELGRALDDGTRLKNSLNAEVLGSLFQCWSTQMLNALGT